MIEEAPVVYSSLPVPVASMADSTARVAVIAKMLSICGFPAPK